MMDFLKVLGMVTLAAFLGFFSYGLIPIVAVAYYFWAKNEHRKLIDPSRPRREAEDLKRWQEQRDKERQERWLEDYERKKAEGYWD